MKKSDEPRVPNPPIPVRLSHDVIAGLDAAAKRMGTNRSALIRFLAHTFVAEFRRRGMSALPHDWAEIMSNFAGPTQVQQDTSSQPPT